MSLFGRAKILFPSDYTAFAIREWRKSQLNLPAGYIKTGNATIEWEYNHLIIALPHKITPLFFGPENRQ